MLVILRENIDNLGRVGDVVKVTDGYARNYLLPRKLVAEAHEGNIKAIEAQKKALEKKRLAQRASASDLAKRLSSVSVTLNRKTGEGDKLFGSVSTGDIAEALAAQGYKVDKRSVHLPHPIKTLGTHDVEVKLEADIVSTIKVIVGKEG